MSFVPFGGPLVGMRQCQDGAFGKRSADDLQTDWKSGRREPARHADCRKSIDVEGPGVSRPAGIQTCVLRKRFNGRGRTRDSRCHQQIDACKYLDDLSAKHITLMPSPDIVLLRHERGEADKWLSRW